MFLHLNCKFSKFTVNCVNRYWTNV